jgi:hypothetical protein
MVESGRLKKSEKRSKRELEVEEKGARWRQEGTGADADATSQLCCAVCIRVYLAVDMRYPRREKTKTRENIKRTLSRESKSIPET